MGERCEICKIPCERPDTPLVPGRWMIVGDSRVLVWEKMEKCAKRMEVIEFGRKN